MSSTEQTAAHSHVHRDDEATKLGMWLFLFTELLLFGGMFIAYSVYRFKNQADFHVAAKELNVLMGTFNTMILLTSSLTMALSIAALQQGKRVLSIIFQVSTLIFGFGFLVNKFFEWAAKFHHGIYPGSDTLLEKGNGQILFFGLYYVMTGLHGLHIIIGMAVIGFMTVQTIKNKITPDNYVRLEAAGLYWHLVDIIWIFLFPLFYLIT